MIEGLERLLGAEKGLSFGFFYLLFHFLELISNYELVLTLTLRSSTLPA